MKRQCESKGDNLPLSAKPGLEQMHWMSKDAGYECGTYVTNMIQNIL